MSHKPQILPLASQNNSIKFKNYRRSDELRANMELNH